MERSRIMRTPFERVRLIPGIAEVALCNGKAQETKP